MKNRKGFTLIELLIVIAIIGILAVSLLPSVLGAPARARDAARKADVLNIVAAVETYNSANGSYPDSSFCITPNPTDTSSNDYKLSRLFKGNKSPQPPSNAGNVSTCNNQYAYCKLISPNNYAIVAAMETDGSSKGYRAGPITDNTTCVSQAITGVDVNGKFFVNVQ